MKRTRALARLEQRLDSDPCAILSTTEVRLLDGEVRRALLASFPGIEPYLTRSEDMTRWQALGARCRQARGARGIRDVSVASGIPQYPVRAIESGHLREIRSDLARRYSSFSALRPGGRVVVPRESRARRPRRTLESRSATACADNQ